MVAHLEFLWDARAIPAENEGAGTGAPPSSFGTTYLPRIVCREKTPAQLPDAMCLGWRDGDLKS